MTSRDPDMTGAGDHVPRPQMVPIIGTVNERRPGFQPRPGRSPRTPQSAMRFRIVGGQLVAVLAGDHRPGVLPFDEAVRRSGWTHAAAETLYRVAAGEQPDEPRTWPAGCSGRLATIEPPGFPAEEFHMIDSRDIKLDIKLTFTLPCGASAPESLVDDFGNVLLADCHMRDGRGAKLHGNVEFLDDGTPAGSLVVALSVGSVAAAEDLVEEIPKLTARFWNRHPQYPLPKVAVT